MSEDPQTSLARPRRRIHGTLQIGADDRRELARALRNLAADLERGGALFSISGGWGSGYILDMAENPEMTHERYVEENEAWLAADGVVVD